MTETTHDIVIVGGGTAGLVTAAVRWLRSAPDRIAPHDSPEVALLRPRRLARWRNA